MLALIFISSGSIILNIVLIMVLKSDAEKFSKF